MPEVVRHEERGERDHDHVVEEEHPAGEEAELVVERTPHECGRPTGLRQRSRSLGVRERDEQEEQADEQQHPGGEPERLERDDPEREEDGRRDLAERDSRERGRLEDALETWELSSHASASPQRYSRKAPAKTKQCPEQVSVGEAATAEHGRPNQDPDAE